MSVYKIHFKWKEREAVIKAQSLDLTHPYFVSVKDLIFTRESKVIIDPVEDDIQKAFRDNRQVMIPFQTVSLIEEIDDAVFQKAEQKSRDIKVLPLSSGAGKPEKTS